MRSSPWSRLRLELACLLKISIWTSPGRKERVSCLPPIAILNVPDVAFPWFLQAYIFSQLYSDNPKLWDWGLHYISRIGCRTLWCWVLYWGGITSSSTFLMSWWSAGGRWFHGSLRLKPGWWCSNVKDSLWERLRRLAEIESSIIHRPTSWWMSMRLQIVPKCGEPEMWKDYFPRNYSVSNVKFTKSEAPSHFDFRTFHPRSINLCHLM